MPVRARPVLWLVHIDQPRRRVPTACGDEVECELVVAPSLPARGMTWARARDRAVIALRTDVAEALARGEPDAIRTAFHELAHVVWDHGVPAGTPQEEAERERRAEIFGEAAVWLLTRR